MSRKRPNLGYSFSYLCAKWDMRECLAKPRKRHGAREGAYLVDVNYGRLAATDRLCLFYSIKIGSPGRYVRLSRTPLGDASRTCSRDSAQVRPPRSQPQQRLELHLQCLFCGIKSKASIVCYLEDGHATLTVGVAALEL